MKPRLTKAQNQEFKRQQDRVAREVDAWGRQNNVRCTCGASGYAGKAGHSSVCPVFKGYYATRFNGPNESKANRLVDRLLSS